VVTGGFAVTVAPVVDDRFVAGLQEKLLAPLAVSVVLAPSQILVLPPTEMAGLWFTVTVTADVPMQPSAEAPVTV
jgi:hypothetical protein